METGIDRLAKFASTLFEEDIQADAVIDEDRLTVEEIIHPDPQDISLPHPAACQPLEDEDTLHYVQRQAIVWGGPAYTGPTITAGPVSEAERKRADDAIEEWMIQLGDWLKSCKLFKDLLTIFQASERNKEGPLTWYDLVGRLVRADLGFHDYPKAAERSLICAAFFALIAQAKEVRSGTAFPLVPTQVQLWIRELRRLGRLVFDKPIFTWLDEPAQEYPSLPTFHCSECGESGWIALHDPRADTLIGARGVVGIHLESDPTRIYRGWFGSRGTHSPSIVVISPWTELDTAAQKATGVQEGFAFTEHYLCPKSLVLRQGDGPCPLSGDPKRFRVKINRDTRQDDQRSMVLGVKAVHTAAPGKGYSSLVASRQRSPAWRLTNYSARC